MRHIEPLNGGLVTVRDPAVLAIGEMQEMQNAVYYPANQAPQRAAGRASFGQIGVSGLPIRGLRSVLFDNGDFYLLAMQGASLYTAVVGDTGSFSLATTYSASGTALDAVQFNDEWFLFGGIFSNALNSSGNIVAYASSTAPGQALLFRTHGLAPNTVQVSTATGAGTWTAGATGYFEYWYTEVLEYVHDGVTSQIESTFSPTASGGAAKVIPTTLFVSSTAMQASITVGGAPINTNATKWRLYRAGPKSLATDQLFPTGFKLAEGVFGATDTILDGSATTGAYVAANATATTGGYPVMANPTNVFASDNVYATNNLGGIQAVSVSFPTFTITNEPIVGIQVAVEYHSSSLSLLVSVSNDGGNTWSSERTLPRFVSDTIIEGGGPDDLWGLNWTSVEVVAGRFLARVRSIDILGTNTASIDQIRAKITSAGTKPLDESSPFPAIVISAAGVDAAVGSHGQPPLATTGDIFQGCMVTNSRRTSTNGALEKSFIRYSLPDQPDYFPDPYYLDFQTSDNDEVTNIKTLNNRLGVFLKTRLYRINYLPTEADADFNRGICREEISSQYGCVNAMCAAVFEGQGGRSELAFVSDKNIHATNLFSVRMLADDLDWRRIIAATNSTPIALVNNIENEELLFYYKNTNNGVEHYKCLHLSYNEKHMRPGGRLKVSGPVNMRNTAGGAFADLYSAWSVRRTNGLSDVFLGYGGDAISATSASAGHVFREQGTAFPASDSTFKIRSRRMYLGGEGNEFKVDRFFCYVASANTNQDIDITLYTTLTNASAGTASASTQRRSWAGEKHFERAFNQATEGLDIVIAQASNNQGHFAPQMIAIDYTDYGIEDSGSV